MDRLVCTTPDGVPDRRYGGQAREGGCREVWLTDWPRLSERPRAAAFADELLHCGLRVDSTWILHYDLILGVQYGRTSDWPAEVAILELPDLPIAWWPPGGLRTSPLAGARYSLGQDVDPPPLTCVTLVARMLGMAQPWPRRPVQLVRTLRGQYGLFIQSSSASRSRFGDSGEEDPGERGKQAEGVCALRGATAVARTVATLRELAGAPVPDAATKESRPTQVTQATQATPRAVRRSCRDRESTERRSYGGAMRIGRGSCQVT